MTEPILSIVIGCYNFAETMHATIQSILMQETEYPYEIIVVDDQSTDNSWELLQAYKQKFPDIFQLYQTKTNAGLGRKAKFQTRAPACGKYICFIDGDDLWYSKDKIQTQVSFLENNPDYIGATHKTVLMKEVDQGDHTPNFFGLHPGFDDTWTIQDMVQHPYRLYCHISANMWRNNHQQEDGFFWPDFMSDPLYFGDLSLYFFYAHNGGKIKWFSDLVSVYQYTQKGVWSQRSAQKKDRILIREWYAIDLLTHLQYHDPIKLKIQEAQKSYTEKYGDPAPCFRPQLIPPEAQKAYDKLCDQGEFPEPEDKEYDYKG